MVWGDWDDWDAIPVGGVVGTWELSTFVRRALRWRVETLELVLRNVRALPRLVARVLTKGLGRQTTFADFGCKLIVVVRKKAYP